MDKEKINEILTKGYNPEASDEERQAQVEALMVTLDLPKASVIQRLVRLGIYKKLERSSKRVGPKEKTKAQLVQDFEQETGLSVPSMAKMARSELLDIIQYVVGESKDEVAA